MKWLFPRLVFVSALLLKSAVGDESPANVPDWIPPLVQGSSVYQKLKSNHAKQGQAPVVWFVDGTEGEHTLIYVGEDHPDHIVRLATLRIHKTTGKVEVETYDKSGEISWIAEKKHHVEKQRHKR